MMPWRKKYKDDPIDPNLSDAFKRLGDRMPKPSPELTAQIRDIPNRYPRDVEEKASFGPLPAWVKTLVSRLIRNLPKLTGKRDG